MSLDQINEFINKAGILFGLLIIAFVLAYHFFGRNVREDK